MKQTLIIYRDWWEAIRGLPSEMQLRAYDAIFAYAFDGTPPDDQVIAGVTALMRSFIDKNKAKYDDVCKKRAEAGKKGMAKRWGKDQEQEPQQPITNITNDNSNNKCYTETTPPEPPKRPAAPTIDHEELSKLESEFEAFRKLYPGSKRGSKIEFEAFKKKHPKTWREIIPTLIPAVKRLIAYHQAAEEANTQGANIFIPHYANLSTWINNSRWEEEFPEIVIPIKQHGTSQINNAGNDREQRNAEFARHIISKLTTPEYPEIDISGNY